ncbi:MAG: MFS transporter [Acidobacteria bacterium]|nr:MFS transporter [Acidobacteriota bacterium]
MYRFMALSALMGAGYGVLFTMLDDYRAEYGIGETALGVLIGAGFLAGFLSQVLIAPMADRGRAKMLVLVGVALNVFGLLVMAAGTTFSILLAGRVVMGIGIGTALPAIRRIVILADPENLGENLGRLVSADVAGFAMGPVLAALLVGLFGIPAPFLVVAVLTVAFSASVLSVSVDESAPGSSPPGLAFDLLRIRPFVGALVLGSAVFLMIGSFDVLWAVVHDDMETAEWIANIGITLFALPLVLLASTGGKLAQRVGPFPVATIGLSLGAFFMLLYGLMPTGGAIFAVAMVHAVSDGITIASTGVAVAITVPADRQAGAQGLLGGFQTLTAGITAVAIGAISESLGRTWAYGTTAIAMAVLVIVGAALSHSAWRSASPVSVAMDPAGVDRST